MGDKSVALLFSASADRDENVTSIVLVVEDFDAATQRKLYEGSEWWTSLATSSDFELFGLRKAGSVVRWSGTGWRPESLGPEHYTRLRQAHDGSVLALGFDGHTCFRTTSGWRTSPTGSVATFHDAGHVDGQAQFICGSEGTLASYSKGGWRRIDLGIRQTFRGIHVSPNGELRLAGEQGQCLRVRGNKVVELRAPEAPYFSVCAFRDRFYWGNSSGVCVEENGQIVPFARTHFAGELVSDGEFLYVAGTDSAWRFDGDSWRRLTLRFDDSYFLVGPSAHGPGRT